MPPAIAMPADELVELATKKSTPKWVKNLMWVAVILTTLSGMGFTFNQLALADPTARRDIAALTNQVRAVEIELQRIAAERKVDAEKLSATLDGMKAEASRSREAQAVISTVGSANAKMLDRVDVKLDTLLQRPVHSHGQ